ncbi:BnaCnng06790D [Brassica napus]|uniref:BnaCnng06790D protein n=1 Tax=Brassica napus TaxID=3708 RepID=A0A078H0G0_BRANA|nr:BnaCnng06790D [Brassica napus]
MSNPKRDLTYMMFDIYMFQVKPALPVLRQLIYLNDEEVLTDACWALSYLSDGPNDKIQAVIQAGVCPLLVELLSHPSPTVLIPALRTVGNIVTGDDSQTLFIIDSGASEVSSFPRMDLMSTPLTTAQIQANLDRKRAAKAAADRKRAADKKKKDKKFNAAVKECKKNTLYEKTLRMLGIKK